MTVAVLGGLLGILMMIPLRRAFIVKQHGKLKYPGRDGLRRGADRRRKRRLDGADGFHRLWHRRGSQVSDQLPAGSGPTCPSQLSVSPAANGTKVA